MGENEGLPTRSNRGHKVEESFEQLNLSGGGHNLE